MNADVILIGLTAALETQYHPFYRRSWRTEIDKQAYLQSSRPEVIHALGRIDIVQRSDGLYLDQNRLVNQ